MNTSSCKASLCLTNNLGLLKIGKKTCSIKEFLPLLPTKEVTPRRRATKLSVSSSGNKNHVESSEEVKNEVLTYQDDGVDIDADKEIVRAIAKTLHRLGGYGRLCSFESSGADKDEVLTYKDAGVDIDAGEELVRKTAKMVHGLGDFGRLCPFEDSFLVGGTDGVGTKLKLAFETGIHETIGIDLVAMSVNDIITSGAKPMHFLDYFAASHLDVDIAEKVIKGIVDGCQQSYCTRLGGEIVEMPGFADGEYDLSGCATGFVKKDALIDGKNIEVGDVLIGLPSSGVHSNGLSLVRRVLGRSGLSLKDKFPGSSFTLGEVLMAPTVIYVKQVLDIISKGGVKGIAHITGGGLTKNITRVFPQGLGALIYKDSWIVPPIFKWIQEVGKIEDVEMKQTFNMGIGMVLVMKEEAALRLLGEDRDTSTVYRIGEVIKGNGVSYI